MVERETVKEDATVVKRCVRRSCMMVTIKKKLSLILVCC